LETFEVSAGFRDAVGGNMKRFIVTLVILLGFIAHLQGQWHILNEGEGTFNTFDFVNDDIGWIGGTWHGKTSLLKTEDGGETWYPLTLEGNYTIEMIDFIDESVGWAIGSEFADMFVLNGNILKTMDGGQTWSLQKKTSFGYSLQSIQAMSDSIVYFIGNYNIFKTSDGGTNWIDISPRNPRNITYEIGHFFNNQTGLVTGHTETQSIILRTKDGGMTWEETLVPEFEWIAAVQFIDDSTGFFSARKPGQDSYSLYKTTDRLKSWSMIDHSHNITTFFFLDRDQVCAIAGNSMLKSTDGGNTWKEKLYLGNLKLDKLYFWNNVGLSFYRGGNIIIGLAPPGRGTLLKSADQGEHWTIDKLTYDFQDVCFINQDRGFAAGGDLYMHRPTSGYGDMFVTDDGGKTWEVSFSTYQKIESCFFVNPTLGFLLSRVIGGSSSDIYKTTDGGKSWENILGAPVDGVDIEGLDICFVNEENGWAVGEGRNLDVRGPIIIATRDGGKNWDASWWVKKYAISQQGPSLKKIFFLYENIGWAVGDVGLILKYTQDHQWQEMERVTTLPLNDVFFIDENNGFISGGYWNDQGYCLSILLKTFNGGGTWDTIPDVPYLINDMYFHDLQHGWAVGSDSTSGVIIATEDGGYHWKVQVDSLNSYLCSIEARENNLWAVGSNGLVLRADLTTATWVSEHQHLPCTFELSQNYPNPFNTRTAISYRLSANSQVELSIYNLLGQRVATLVSAKQSPGSYSAEWDGAEFSSGVYFCRMEAGDFVKTIKLAMVK
jgi:photosystem II stability/assembly factor-like uncharacterized protein